MVSFGSGFKLDVLFEFIILGNQYNVAETVNKDGGKKRQINANISLSQALINKPILRVHYLRCVAYVVSYFYHILCCVNASTFSVA